MLKLYRKLRPRSTSFLYLWRSVILLRVVHVYSIQLINHLSRIYFSNYRMPFDSFRQLSDILERRYQLLIHFLYFVLNTLTYLFSDVHVLLYFVLASLSCISFNSNNCSATNRCEYDTFALAHFSFKLFKHFVKDARCIFLVFFAISIFSSFSLLE